MNREEIQTAMNSLVSAAEAETRSLSSDEISQYTALEGQLTALNTTAEIAKRNQAYNTTAPVFIPNKQEDTLERAFESYLRTGQANNDITELRAQSTSASAGGYMVPDGFRQKMVDVTKAFGGLSAHAEHFNNGVGAPVEYPSNNDTANTAAKTAEGVAPASAGADLVFGTVNLTSFKYSASGTGNNPLKVSVELLQDSAFDVNALIARKLSTRLYRAMSPLWVVGAGSTTEPEGIATTTKNIEVVDGDLYEALLDLEAELDASYDANAKFLMSKATWTAIRKLNDTVGRPLVLGHLDPATGKAQRVLFGAEVVIDPAMPTLASGDNAIIYGDLFESFVIRDVAAPVITVNPYTSANAGQVEYSAWARTDSRIQNRSAYVTLADETVESS